MKRALLIVVILVLGFIAYSILGETEGLVEKSSVSEEDPLPEDYSISVTAEPVTEFVVILDVMTTLPLPVDVLAGVSIKGQAPTDTYIGTSERVTLSSEKQTIKIDGSAERLPSGEYVAEVTFFPEWGAENGSAQAQTIEQKVIGTADVSLGGTGESKARVDQRNKAQKWVMESVTAGILWDQAQFVEKLGEFEKTSSTLNQHDDYYFPEVDLTIIVGRVDNKVATWRMGEATK